MAPRTKTAKTPKASRSKSPPTTRSRATRRASIAAKSESSPKSPVRSRSVKKSPTPKKMTKKSLVESSTSEDEAPKPIAKRRAPAKTAAIEHGNPAATVVVVRIIYLLLLVVAVCVSYKPDEFYKVLGSASKDYLLSIAILSTVMQYIAVAQGPFETQKKSLQYGMISWILLVANTLHSKAEMNESAPIVLTCLILIAVSVWACYYSQ